MSTSDRDPLETVYAYHQRTMHYPGRFAASLGYMDWATQPDPFRRYAGARLVSLDKIAPTQLTVLLLGESCPSSANHLSLAAPLHCS